MVQRNELGLVPIRNFGEIAPNIYRSAQPYYDYEYAWLKNTLGLDWIVNLRSELNHDALFVVKYGLNFYNFPVKDHNAPTLQQAKDFQGFIKGRMKEQVLTLIHCEHGHGRTSTFSCLAKMALGMTVEQAIADEKERFHYQFKHHAQEEWLREYSR